MLDCIRLENLLSFQCADLALRPLNVIIGPNGSGKSNLLTGLEILRSVRLDLRAGIRSAGGIDLRWRGVPTTSDCQIKIVSDGMRYELTFDPTFGFIGHESLSPHEHDRRRYVFLREKTHLFAVPNDASKDGSLSMEAIRSLKGMHVNALTSALSVIKDHERHLLLTLFGDAVESIRVARPMPIGPNAAARLPQSVNEDETRLLEDGSNLALVLSNLISSGLQDRIDDLLSRFLSSYKRLAPRIEGGAIRMFLSERGLSEPIPASRFSDGTLVFLRLVALLYEPSKPMILAIEEPEAGLHPDAVRLVAEMLRDASSRKQIVVTTHSPELIDALSDDPESIVVCEKDEENGTQFRRLSSEDMAAWLKHYTLGELWTKGEIGGNRW